MSRTLTALVFTLLLGHSSARAEPVDPAPAQTFVFEDELVSGDLVSPLGEVLRVRNRGTRASLIEVRTSSSTSCCRASKTCDRSNAISAPASSTTV